MKNNMKNIYMILAVLSSVTLIGCSKMVSDPVFGENEFYIYSSAWTDETEVRVGVTFIVDDLYVSPDDGSVKCIWTLDGETVSNHRTFRYTFNQTGKHELIFRAVRNGAEKVRKTTLNVI